MWYWVKILFLVFVGAIAVWIGYELITFPNISSLRNENPTTSSLIEYRISRSGRRRQGAEKGNDLDADRTDLAESAAGRPGR